MTNQINKSFILHKDSLSVLNKLSDDQAGKLFKTIFSYHTQNILPSDKFIAVVFEPFLNQFKRDAENYKKTCEARKIAGSKGGKQKVANASKSKQKVAKLADSDSKNKSDSDNNKIKLETINPIYQELSNELLTVLQSKLQKNISNNKWPEDFKLLVEKDLSVRTNPVEDVKKVIQAIANNYGKEYFPVVQSSSSLREKFTKIENYVKRSNQTKFTNQSQNSYTKPDDLDYYARMIAHNSNGGKNGV
jgi:hypothetical protein